MQTSPQGQEFIARQEGLATRAYRDSAGVWTIGVGHTAAAGAPIPKQGMTITHEEALAILANDLPRYERRVNKRLLFVKQNVYDGSVSFDFNTGAIDRASWVRAFAKGDRAGTRAGLLKWVKAGGRTVAGLVNRRNAEADLILDGDYGEPGRVPNGAQRVATSSKLHELGHSAYSIVADTAVRDFQRANDLVVDGFAGPVTQTTIDRRLAEKGARSAIPKAAGGAAAAAGAATLHSAHPVLTALAVGGAVAIVAVVAFFVWHYRGAIRQWIITTLGGRA